MKETGENTWTYTSETNTPASYTVERIGNTWKYTASDGQSYTLEKDGNEWTYTFQVYKATWYVFPIGSTYKITEVAGAAYRASFTVVDGNAGEEGNTGKILLAKDDNVNTNTKLSMAKETVEKGEEITVTFTNEIVRKQELRLVKAMDTPVAYDENQVYRFRIQFKKLGDGYTFNSGIGKIVADQSGEAEKEFSLIPGEENRCLH